MLYVYYSVLSNYQTLTYLEGARLIIQFKIILLYCVKCQRRAECWFIFLSFQLDICIPVRMDRKCRNNPGKFCYICGNVVLPNSQAKITEFVKKVYRDYFWVNLGEQYKSFTPHVCCKTFVGNFRDWSNGKRKRMLFAISIVWREGKNHITECYFSMINLKGINQKNKHRVQYLQVPSVIRPTPYAPNLPVPEPHGNIEYSFYSDHSDMIVIAGDDACKPQKDNQPVP